MNPETLAIFFGLASAMTWGAGDFSGGLATKKTTVYTVVLISQIVGGFFLVGLALLFRETVPPVEALLWGAVAGLAGVVGLLALYRGLADGRMGIVAPLTAVLSAAIPILFSLFGEGAPSIAQMIGFGLALAAVWLLSGVGGRSAVQPTELGLALVAGTGFALFFIFIDQANEKAVFWPLAAARLTSVSCLMVVVFVRTIWERPLRSQMPPIILAGVLDALGNAFFVLAARFGRLDLAAVLASLYPATTVLLAQLFLHERLNQAQWIGILIALLAIVFITM
ncbi:MAG: DMT family transporter [Chloroflexi bacterium]|nr:DMT family transporter [Chloroflexota bacterium]